MQIKNELEIQWTETFFLDFRLVMLKDFPQIFQEYNLFNVP